MDKIDALEKMLGSQNTFIIQIKSFQKINPSVADYMANLAIDDSIKALQKKIAQNTEKIELLQKLRAL